MAPLSPQFYMSSALQSFGGILVIFLVKNIYHRILQYNALKNLPGPSSSSLLTGNLDKFLDPQSVPWHMHLTERYGSAVRLTGLLGEPQVFLSDPRGLDSVLQKQADVFEKPDFLVNVHMGCFGEGSGSVTGAQHRKQRKRLGPALTMKSSKQMAPRFYQIAFELRNVFKKQLLLSTSGKAEIDVRRWLGRAALELVAQGGMGYSFELMDDTKEPHPYNEAAGQLFQSVTELPAISIMLFHPFTRIGSPAFRQFLSSFIPLNAVKQLKRVLVVLDDAGNEIYKRAKETMESDKESWKEENERRQSIISCLLSENKQVSSSEKLSDDEIVGMINSLIFAAHDTTAASMTRCLHVLAEMPDLQKRLRKEIRTALELNKELDLDQLMELPLLDAFIKETLRAYPPLPSMPRIARKDAVIPLQHPVLASDGITMIDKLHVKAGTIIQAAMTECNLNPKTWGPDAREFRIERWLEPLPKSVTDASIPGMYSHLMSFFGGSRSCMGWRFSIYEMKIILSVLLEQLEFSVGDHEITWLNYTILAPHVTGDPSLVNRLPLIVSQASEEN